ncbi:haloacid dehalogenase [Spirochaetia bacterium]|nr:haloacid dehalogenase [Spirochaetia bacterium]
MSVEAHFIKAVAFDFGNVICFSPPEGQWEKIAAMAGLPLHTLDELDRQYRGDLLDRGTLDTKGYYKFILEQAGVFPGDEALQKIAQADSDGWKEINPGTEALMQEIQQAGFKLGILSNMPHDFLAWGRTHIEVFRNADVGIFSCELGLIKPESGIYGALITALGCKAEEVVFFDDLKDNIDKAVDLGIHGFIWKDPETARKDLRSVHVIT